ncbi:hypothetical protein ABZY05_37275 [Streptomyces canus]
MSAVLPELMNVAARQLTDLNPARAADMVVDILLNGLGAGVTGTAAR